MSTKIHPYSSLEEIHLPNEILAVIIDNLAPDVEDNGRTQAALASCRLASRVLHSLATPLLFSSVHWIESLVPWINPIDRVAAFKERAIKLKDILSSSFIAASVHTLALRCQSANLMHWSTGALFTEILHRLPHIRTFILESRGGTIKFSGLARGFISAIESLCRSPNLTRLDLESIQNVPRSLITGAGPNLKHLHLSGVHFSFDPKDPYSTDETSTMQPYELDSLEIDKYCIEFFSSLPGDTHSPFTKHLSRIKNLRIRNISHDLPTFNCGWSIVLLASQCLTTLDLPWDENLYSRPVFPYSSNGVLFDLGQLPALRHFKIRVSIFPDHNINIHRSLGRLLSISSSISHIETVEIAITWYDVEKGHENDLFSSYAGWSILDEALSSEKFVSLTKVVLGLCLEVEEEDRSKAYYHNRMNLDALGTSSIPPYVNHLFSNFKGLTSTQRTLELHVEII